MGLSYGRRDAGRCRWAACCDLGTTPQTCWPHRRVTLQPCSAQRYVDAFLHAPQHPVAFCSQQQDVTHVHLKEATGVIGQLQMQPRKHFTCSSTHGVNNLHVGPSASAHAAVGMLHGVAQRIHRQPRKHPTCSTIHHTTHITSYVHHSYAAYADVNVT